MKNPFLYRDRPYPLKLIVDIHSYCNARCTMCPYPKYTRRQTQGKMPWPLYEDIVNELAAIGRDHRFRPLLTYCYMGEPFLAEDLDRYVSFALERNIEVYLNTNASVMTPPKVDALLAAGFKGKIHISFHGISPEVYERITGLDYQTTLRHTLYLIEKYPPGNILIRGVDDRWPPGEKQKWSDFWRAKQVQLEYLPPISRCGALSRLLPDRLKHAKTRRLFGCRENLPLVEMVILFDGRAVMCCEDMGREMIWGDVGRDGLLGVWNGSRRRAVVTKLYNGKSLPGDFLCYRCEMALGAAGLVKSIARAAWHKCKSHNRKSRAAAL